MEAFFHERLKSFDGASDAFRAVEEDTYGGTEGAAWATFVVDVVPVFGVYTAGQDEVVDDAVVHVWCEDGRAVRVFGVADAFVGAGNAQEGAAV